MFDISLRSSGFSYLDLVKSLGVVKVGSIVFWKGIPLSLVSPTDSDTVKDIPILNSSILLFKVSSYSFISGSPLHTFVDISSSATFGSTFYAKVGLEKGYLFLNFSSIDSCSSFSKSSGLEVSSIEDVSSTFKLGSLSNPPFNLVKSSTLNLSPLSLYVIEDQEGDNLSLSVSTHLSECVSPLTRTSSLYKQVGLTPTQVIDNVLSTRALLSRDSLSLCLLDSSSPSSTQVMDYILLKKYNPSSVWGEGHAKGENLVLSKISKVESLALSLRINKVSIDSIALTLGLSASYLLHQFDTWEL